MATPQSPSVPPFLVYMQNNNLSKQSERITQLYSDSQALSTKVADCALKTVDNGYSGRNLYYTSSNIGKDSWTKAPILISSKNPNNGQRAQIGFENQGTNAGVLWLDTNGELHFTDQAGTDHVISWKG